MKEVDDLLRVRHSSPVKHKVGKAINNVISQHSHNRNKYFIIVIYKYQLMMFHY